MPPHTGFHTTEQLWPFKLPDNLDLSGDRLLAWSSASFKPHSQSKSWAVVWSLITEPQVAAPVLPKEQGPQPHTFVLRAGHLILSQNQTKFEILKSGCKVKISLFYEYLKTLNAPDQSQSHHQSAYCEQHVSSPCSGQSSSTSAFDPSKRRESGCLTIMPGLGSCTTLAKIIWLSVFGTRVWHALRFLASGHILAMAYFRLVCACNLRGKYTVSNTLHDYWRNNSLHFLARGRFLGRYHSLTEMLVGRDLWRFSLQLKAELLLALGQVSHVFCSWVFKTHSKDGDSTSTLISLSNCFPNSSLNLSRHNLWPLPLLQLGISYFQEIFDSVVFVIPLGIVVGCYLITSWPPLHPRCLSVSFR